jgi:hypothetical protein
MAAVQEPLDLRVLRVIEELLKDRAPGGRTVDAGAVLQRMRLGPEAKPEVAEAMGHLLDQGDVRGKALTGDNQVLDVDVKAITEQGVARLYTK